MKTTNTIAKKLTWTTFLFVTFISFTVKSQNSFTLPEGYQTFKDYDGKEQRADGDFDGDGISDLAILCSAENQSPIVVIYLTSHYLVGGNYFWFPWQSEMNSFTFINNVLTIDGAFDNGRYGTTLKLKYYASIKNMKLIGYGDNYLGDYENNGAYDKNINLNTGEYQVNGGVKKKISLDLITLSNIEKYFDYLGQVGQNEIDK
jgi:hypothetical protein